MERKKAETFEDLVVWQKAHEFVLGIYKFTANFPKSERYGLTSQFRRAAVSIAANIAEGFKKKSTKDKLRFYNISQGSLAEVKYYLILSKDLKSGDVSKLSELLKEVSKLLTAYCKVILTV
jgi:four helix bundle protein